MCQSTRKQHKDGDKAPSATTAPVLPALSLLQQKMEEEVLPSVLLLHPRPEATGLY